MFCEKGVLKNFAKFTGKYLCQSLFLNKVAGAAGYQVLELTIRIHSKQSELIMLDQFFTNLQLVEMLK